MFKKFFENRTKMRVDRMKSKVSNLTDFELKQWYQFAECDGETDLVTELENELSSRGFVHMIDY